MPSLPAMAPSGGELVVDEGAGVEQGDAELLDLAGDRAKDGLGIAALEGKEDGGGLEVGHQPVKELLGFHLPGHEGVAGTEGLEGVEHLADLADVQSDAFAFQGKLAMRDGSVSSSMAISRSGTPDEPGWQRR
jgi:hypothetical protein